MKHGKYIISLIALGCFWAPDTATASNTNDIALGQKYKLVIYSGIGESNYAGKDYLTGATIDGDVETVTSGIEGRAIVGSFKKGIHTLSIRAKHEQTKVNTDNYIAQASGVDSHYGEDDYSMTAGYLGWSYLAGGKSTAADFTLELGWVDTNVGSDPEQGLRSFSEDSGQGEVVASARIIPGVWPIEYNLQVSHSSNFKSSDEITATGAKIGVSYIHTMGNNSIWTIGLSGEYRQKEFKVDDRERTDQLGFVELALYF